MKRRYSLRNYIAANSEDSESFPFCTIIEIADMNRVLIENHLGIIRYSCNTVGVRVSYGNILVCGAELSIKHMTRMKLVITGRIDGIQLCRGNTQ